VGMRRKGREEGRNGNISEAVNDAQHKCDVGYCASIRKYIKYEVDMQDT
jgi:hypothetical protein